MTISQLRHDHFYRHKGDIFQAESKSGPVDLVLQMVKIHGGGLREGGAFSLIFHGPAESAFPQGTYPVRHESLGEDLLFIVPLERDAQTVAYQAVFS